MIGRGGADEEDPIAQSEAAVAMDQDDPRKWPAPLRFIGDAAKLDPGHGGIMFDNDAGDVAVGLGNAEKARDGAPAHLPEPLQLPSGIEIGVLDAEIAHVAPGGGASATSWAPKKLSPGPACSLPTEARQRPWFERQHTHGPTRTHTHSHNTPP